MNDDQKRTLSAHVEARLIDYIDQRAQLEGLTRSGMVERMLFEASEKQMRINYVPFQVVGKINCRGTGVHPLDACQPAVMLLDCVEGIWPSHVVRIFAEWGETEDDGSADDYYLWHPNGQMEKFEPDESWLKRKRAEFEKRRRELF